MKTISAFFTLVMTLALMCAGLPGASAGTGNPSHDPDAARQAEQAAHDSRLATMLAETLEIVYSARTTGPVAAFTSLDG